MRWRKGKEADLLLKEIVVVDVAQLSNFFFGGGAITSEPCDYVDTSD